MTTFTIKTANGFNTTDNFTFINSQTTTQKASLWIETDSVSGVSHRWFGTGISYDASGKI